MHFCCLTTTKLDIDSGVNRGSSFILDTSSPESSPASPSPQPETQPPSLQSSSSGDDLSDTPALTPFQIKMLSCLSVFPERIHTRLQSILDRMLSLPNRVLIISLVISVMILAALCVGPLITRRNPRPSPFFKSEGHQDADLIRDFFTGDLTQLSLNILEHEVSFTMYYAHWDLDSLRFRSGYKSVAHYFENQGIFFAAINCWWSEGECIKVMRLRRYPIFLAHVRGVGDVEYRGPLVASYMIPFLENILNPLVPINSPGDLLQLRSRHDAVVLRFCDFSRSLSTNYAYSSLLEASVKGLGFDPWRRVSFAVVTNRKVAHKLRVLRPGSLYLFLWNSTHELNLGGDASDSKTEAGSVRHGKGRHMTPVPSPLFPDSAMKWIYDTVESRGRLVDWVTSSGIKSNILSTLTSRKATLILFTPRNQLLSTSPYFDILREVSMDYLNCDKLNFVRSLIHRSILRRVVLQDKLLNLQESCHEIEKPNLMHLKQLNNDSCCSNKIIDFEPSGKIGVRKKCSCSLCIQVDLKKYPSGGNPFNCQASLNKHLNLFSPEFHSSDQSQRHTLRFCSDIKQSFQPRYTPFYRVEASCGHFLGPTLPTSESLSWKDTHDGHEDEDTHEDLISLNQLSFGSNSSSVDCLRLKLALNYSDFTFPQSPAETIRLLQGKDWRTGFTGLGCNTNKTLNFVAIDSILFPSFAESLGIDIKQEIHSTAAVIFDSVQESLYLLRHPSPETTISKKTFYEFIQNYTKGSLTRFLRTDKKGTVSASEQCLSTVVTGRKERNIICVPELTSESFSSLISLEGRQTEDLLLFYYTSWCGFCSAVSHVFLSVARFFSGVKGIILARINADKNDLPVNFSVDRYPSVVFFSGRK